MNKKIKRYLFYISMNWNLLEGFTNYAEIYY